MSRPDTSVSNAALAFCGTSMPASRTSRPSVSCTVRPSSTLRTCAVPRGAGLQAGLSAACAAAASSVTSPKPIATRWRNGALLERLAAPCDGTEPDQPMAGIS